MFCNKCGKFLSVDTEFCPECGNKIVKDAVNTNVAQTNTRNINTNVAQTNLNNINTNVNRNNVQPVQQYQQPVQQQYQQPVQQYQQPVQQYQQPRYQQQYTYTDPTTYKRKSRGGGIGVFIIFIIVGFIGFKLFNKYGDILVDQPIIPNGYEGETPPTQRRSNGQTALDIENHLYNKRISSASDVLNYIREDGDAKRKSCPSEIKSIEEKIQSEFGITAVNLCEIDVKFAQGLYEGIKWSYQQFPGIRGKLTNLTIANMDSSGTIAYFRPIFDFVYEGTNENNSARIGFKMTIAANAAYYLNESKFEQAVSNDSKAGHFPPNATQYSPLVHEFGHCASYVSMMNLKGVSSVLIYDDSNYTVIQDLMEDFADGITSKKLIEEAYNQYLRDGNQQMEFDAWRATISKYAVYKNPQNEYVYDETIAEAVHDVYLNGNSAKPASRYIFNVIKKYVG